jgi:hypothetical protein
MRIKTTLNVTLLAILISIFTQACLGTSTSSTVSNTSRTAFSAETSTEVEQLEIRVWLVLHDGTSTHLQDIDFPGEIDAAGYSHDISCNL